MVHVSRFQNYLLVLVGNLTSGVSEVAPTAPSLPYINEAVVHSAAMLDEDPLTFLSANPPTWREQFGNLATQNPSFHDFVNDRANQYRAVTADSPVAVDFTRRYWTDGPSDYTCGAMRAYNVLAAQYKANGQRLPRVAPANEQTFIVPQLRELNEAADISRDYLASMRNWLSSSGCGSEALHFFARPECSLVEELAAIEVMCWFATIISTQTATEAAATTTGSGANQATTSADEHEAARTAPGRHFFQRVGSAAMQRLRAALHHTP